MTSSSKKSIISSGNDVVGKNDNPGLDLYFALVREVDSRVIRNYIKTIIDSELAVDDLFILLFATRNCRGGKGQRIRSYEVFDCLYEHFPNTCHNILHLFPHYGYWKDLLNIIERFKSNYEAFGRSSIEEMERFGNIQLPDKCVEIIANKLKEDMENLQNDLPISLACKYAPRENMHFARYCPSQFNLLLSLIFGDSTCESKKKYRKMISSLSDKIDVVERKMCADEYSKIDFKKAPSICVYKFRKAFLNELVGSERLRFPLDEDRMICRTNIIESSSVKRVKLQPHLIIRNMSINNGFMYSMNKISVIQTAVLESQWNSMRESLKTKYTRQFLAMSDVSLSMMHISSSVVPIHVSVALGILLSELTEGPFANKTMTFSYNPRYINLSGSLSDKIKQITNYRLCEMKINLISAFQLILNVAIDNNLTEVPSLVIFTDIKFDKACENIQSTFQEINQMFTENHLRIPTLIYWNLYSDENSLIKMDEINTVLMSGFSQSLFKYLIFNEDIQTPLSIYQNMLLDDMYRPVRDALALCGGSLLCR